MNYLCLDSQGIHVEIAAGLIKGGNKVKFYTSWEADLKFEYYAAGKGFEGLDKVLYPADWYEWADCIVNFDVSSQDEIAFLRKIYPKKSIYGAGNGAKIEQDRWIFKKILRDVGLSVKKAEKIKGISNLRKHLQTNKDKYVKINIFRGDIESFYAKDFSSVEMILDEIETAFGPFKEDYDFIVEDMIKSEVEIGFDGFFNGNEFLKPYIIGYEWKKMFYLGRVTDTLPRQMQETLDKMLPVFKKVDYRGAISTEEKIVSKKEHYFIDLCARLPSPLCALYPEYILNWPEVVYKLGKKENVKLDIKHKYLGSMPLNSYHGMDNWTKIDLDPKDRDHIKFYCVAQNNGHYYSIKGCEKIAIVVAGGNTVDEVLDLLKKYAEKVDAFGLDKDAVSGIDHIKDKIKQGESLGISF